MKVQIRKNVFETNSSSTHSLCICSKKEFAQWIHNEFCYDSWEDKIIDKRSMNIENIEECRYLTFDECRYLTFDEWNNSSEWAEKYMKEYKTEGGEEIIVFGKFGYDG